MKHVQIVSSFHNVLEGWAHTGMIWNVGEEHTPGLRVIHADRAQQLIKAGRAVEHNEGDVVLSPKANDPAFLAARQRALNQATVAIDKTRQTKVMPPPLTKQPAVPPRPQRVPVPAGGGPKASTRSASRAPASSPAGGPTGAKAASASSSPVAKAASTSTGRPRGLRRADPAFEAKRASSRSTKAGSSGPTPTSSTEPTDPSGNSTPPTPQKVGAAGSE